MENVCQHCKDKFESYATICESCNLPVGFPNVRKAQEECEFLDIRLKLARDSIEARNIKDVADEFYSIVKNEAAAVIQRNIDSLLKWLIDEPLYKSFYKQVSSKQRKPENNQWDYVREGVDTALFPYYKDDICFAALSLTGLGLKKYGNVSIKLNTNKIQHRASLFEENSVIFMKRHQVLVGSSDLPLGYRATWDRKGDLALAKLHSLLNLGMDQSYNQFQNILLSNGSLSGGEGTDDSDFIEIHIFGDLHRNCIESVVLDNSQTLKVRMLKEKLKDLDIPVSCKDD